MNKRQAKKAFKKMYGGTPNQAKYILAHAFDPDFVKKIAETLVNGIVDGIQDAFKQSKEMYEAFQKEQEETKAILGIKDGDGDDS